MLISKSRHYVRSMKHEVIHTSPIGSGSADHATPHGEAERPLRRSLLRGWKRRCPHCGGGSMFNGYLSVRDECDICGETLSHHRADDAPSWLTMIVVGHLIAPVMLTVYQTYDLPVWVHAMIWPLLAIVGVLVLLPRLKGVIVAFQWAHRMHGFDDRR